jgi:hypothetical protein
MVEHFKYLGTTVTYQNSIQEAIKSRLKSGNLSSSSLLSKNNKIKIYRTIILPVVLYECETWLLILTEKCRLRVFKNRVLRRIFGRKRVNVTGEWKRLHNEQLNDLFNSTNIIQLIRS